MLRRTKGNLHKALISALGIISLFFAGMASCNSIFISQETLYKRVAKLSEKNNHNLAYSTICYGEEGQNETINAFGASWSNNFSGSSQIIPACLDAKTNECKTFQAGIQAMENVFIGNLRTYSNQKDLHRFEVAWINVYEAENFHPYTYSENNDGFVFLPDFYADKLIAKSGGIYKTYDDLLPSSATDSQPRLQYLTVSDGNINRKWAIVGIYHAKGFNVNYLSSDFVYNDGDFGDALNLFGSPFLIAYDSPFFRERLNGLVIFSEAKQYSIERQTKSLAIFDEDKKSNISFYSVKNGTSAKMDGYSSIQISYLFQNDIPPLYFVFIFLANISVIVFFFLVRYLPYEKAAPFLCFTALGPFVFALIGPVCANAFGSQFPFLYSFFSYYFGAFSLIVLGIAAGFFVYNIKKKRDRGNEK